MLRADLGVRRRCRGSGQHPGGCHDGQGRQNETEQRPLRDAAQTLACSSPCGFRRAGSEPELDEAPDRLGPRRQVGLLLPPFLDGVHL